MKRSKKIFLIIASIFFIGLVILGYDISQRTTFPGSEPLLKEKIFTKDSLEKDSLNADTK